MSGTAVERADHMTPSEATSVSVRLRTAIMALEAALPYAQADDAPEVDIVMALQYARQAKGVADAILARGLRVGLP